MKNNLLIDITLEDLRRIIYFILMKFQSDSHHLQGTSQKSDLIGGYIERWFNKAAERIIFEQLLKDRDYTAVSDDFLYTNATEKNAPDIIGLDLGNKTIPFTRFNNGSWVTVRGMPRIEVKVLRKNQVLAGIREPQMIDDYYIFVESDLKEDYLSAIFEDKLFDKKYLENISLDKIFIEKDDYNQIIAHSEIKKADKIGTLRLIGVYTKSDFLGVSKLCKKGINPYYFSRAENKSPRRVETDESLITDNKDLFTYKYDGNYFSLPVMIKASSKVKIKIIKKNKGSVYLSTSEPIEVGGYSVDAGDVRLEYKIFERSSGWNENVVLKSVLNQVAEDSTENLIRQFDEIASY